MAWEKYLNKSGRSGVEAYELLGDGINVRFKSGDEYFYPTESNGTGLMGDLQSTADHGEFLNRTINREQPKFSKGAHSGPIGDDRKLTESERTRIGGITDTYMKRNPSVADQLRLAKFKRMAATENFTQWQQLRKGK
jgi:hypothetical protein